MGYKRRENRKKSATRTRKSNLNSLEPLRRRGPMHDIHERFLTIYIPSFLTFFTIGQVQLYNYNSNVLMKFASFGDYYARVVRYNKNVPNFAAFGLANGMIKFY